MIITGKKFSKPSLSRVINGDDELIVAAEKPERIRLDHKLVELYSDYNRNTLQKFIRAGFVTVDGEVTKKPNTGIDPNAEVILTVPEEIQDPKKFADDGRFATPETIFENDFVKVVNKPSGLLSMAKGEFCPEPTLEDYGLLVHRLDRDTSGVVILAKDEETQTYLRKQFQDRKTHKTYYAVVEGRPKLDKAKIDLPIIRNLKHPTTFLVDANGKPSQTFYRVIKSNDKYSLVELKPTTGRTHQLRVHLKYIGTPIVGDRVYGSAAPDTKERLYLHAKALEITIPTENGNERQTFEAPLPDEFNKFFE